ncbi:uncharacterized protein [Rutidosis leptorrhynchoides]|uniref:uncharacterized protein n=1 Tax=Rutidosis leptorrhynchoides TaxID=125765 RepID=UPI003A9A1563
MAVDQTNMVGDLLEVNTKPAVKLSKKRKIQNKNTVYDETSILIPSATTSTYTQNSGIPTSANDLVSNRQMHKRRRLQQQNILSHISSSSNVNESGMNPFYHHLGPCDNIYVHCGAFFWLEERVRRSFSDIRIHYHQCCGDGRVIIPSSMDPPNLMKELLDNNHFMNNIRAYNQMFSMTSLGAQIDESVNTGNGPYVFKISGQIYHWIGSLCPADGDAPRFLQLYIYDTEHAVTNRMRHFGGDNGGGEVLAEIVAELIEMLNKHNKLVQLFRTARDKLIDNEVPPFRIRLFNAPGQRQYDLPTSDSIGAIVFDSGPKSVGDYDVIIEQKGGLPQRINKLHQHYMSLQYPLLFIYGEPELDRIDYKRNKQEDIRSDYLAAIYDGINRGDQSGIDIGSRLILPASFTEIRTFMSNFPQLTPTDRPDIVVRIYQQKLKQLLAFLKEDRAFGDVKAVLYTIEFQKRGLPHCHLLLWINSFTSITALDVDTYISAELPDPRIDPCGLSSCIRFNGTRSLWPSKIGRAMHESIQIILHLENFQSITFRARESLQSIAKNEGKKKTTLTEWLTYNKYSSDGHTLTYIDFPSKFVWNTSEKMWSPRRRSNDKVIGRVACEMLGLLGDDREWDIALEEATITATSSKMQLQTLAYHQFQNNYLQIFKTD